MKTYTSFYKYSLILVLTCLCHLSANAQDSSFFKRKGLDTSKSKLNMDAVYNRPFLSAGKSPIAIGGYFEANSQYASTDGVSDGLSFQMRRMTLFISSTIAKKIKFLSELEFEDGTREINLEFAAMDIEFHPILNFRGGILMNPIGAFNQNHDGPRWDFIDRPISATTIIPSTLSNAGFGFYGKHFTPNLTIGYEAYLTNGFDDNIVSNSQNRTALAEGKLNPARFEENNSGLPMFTGKIALKNRKIGEIGFSYLRGVYNQWQKDELILDKKRAMQILALDFYLGLLKNKLAVTGEAAFVNVNLPETYSQNYANKQMGAYIDFVFTLVQKPIGDWNKAKINLVMRLEHTDYNLERFKETNTKIGDEIWAIVPGISFRPIGTTVLRFNYRYHEQTDFLRNPAQKTGIIQFGLSSYF
jgi:hypothetical protein